LEPTTKKTHNIFVTQGSTLKSPGKWFNCYILWDRNEIRKCAVR